MNLYDILFSLQTYLSQEIDIRVDIIYDGYKYPNERPFFTVEILPDERIDRAKRREAVQVIEHIQLGYHAEHFTDRLRISEQVADLLTFNKIPYYRADEPNKHVGFFDVRVNAVVPMTANELNRESEYHRVYFDLEIENIKRKGRD